MYKSSIAIACNSSSLSAAVGFYYVRACIQFPYRLPSMQARTAYSASRIKIVMKSHVCNLQLAIIHSHTSVDSHSFLPKLSYILPLGCMLLFRVISILQSAKSETHQKLWLFFILIDLLKLKHIILKLEIEQFRILPIHDHLFVPL